MTTANRPVVIIGAGVAGLTAALALAGQGLPVIVCEKEAAVGGKMRQLDCAGQLVDSGPTVFTMRHIFDELFGTLGLSLDDHITLEPLSLLARHYWDDGSKLDLFADITASSDAIREFAGRREALGFRDFVERACATYEALDAPFMRDASPSMGRLLRQSGLGGLPGLMTTNPMVSLWRALSRHFKDPRLRQLFGRYATYCGSSPFLAPSVLMLVAWVELAGVWKIKGGMYQLASTLKGLAEEFGADIRTSTAVARITTGGGRADGVVLADGSRIDAQAVLFNGDVSALGAGLLGVDVTAAASMTQPQDRTQSALVWSMSARMTGLDLPMHTVFFGNDYASEFDDVFSRHRPPMDPTVYLCAQDRDDRCLAQEGPERLLCLINAPATGDTRDFTAEEIAPWEEKTFSRLARHGLSLDRTAQATRLTTPTGFNQLFPGTGGALYGRASHGWQASFQRPSAKSPLPGLYLAGGSCHPGPGVPMAALSGRMAADLILRDPLVTTSASTAPSRPVAMSGGT